MASTDPASGPRRPRVSIGLPVFNGERHIAETIRSILKQTHRDFELLISDNASSDSTPDIVRELARSDPRVRHHRNENNIGADRNFNRCVELSNGDYFWGIGYDDLPDPEYLESCVAALDADPGLVLCHSRVRKIDDAGAIVGAYESQNFSTSDRPHTRLFDTICCAKWTIAGHGVLRLSALRRTPLLIPHPAADAILQAELALLGRIHEVPKTLFSHRIPWVPSGARDRMAWSRPERGDALVFPHWRRLGELFRSVSRTRVGFGEAFLCYLQIGRYTFSRRMAIQLPRDLKNAAAKLFARTSRFRGVPPVTKPPGRTAHL